MSLLQIQTQSIENIRKQITNKVSYLVQITQHPVQTNFPKLSGPAHSVKSAVQNLIRVAESLDLGDVGLQQDIKQANHEVLASAQMLLQSIEEIKQTLPPVDCQRLHKFAKQILNKTVEILLIWDESEIRKIIRAAQCTQDRLKLVQVSRSMRALLVCYNGFYEFMMFLIQLTLQRQQDLIDELKRDKIQNSLVNIKICLAPFSQAMQDYIRNPNNEEIEIKKNDLANQISVAIDGIVSALRVTDTQTDDFHLPAAATNIKHVPNIKDTTIPDSINKKFMPDSNVSHIKHTHVPAVPVMLQPPDSSVPVVQDKDSHVPAVSVMLQPADSSVPVVPVMQFHLPDHIQYHHDPSVVPIKSDQTQSDNFRKQATNEDVDYDDMYTISSNTTDTESDAKSDTMAIQIKKIEDQLSEGQRYQIQPELDTLLHAIITNSESVAEKSKPHFKQQILELCDDVKSARQDLQIHYDAYKNNPDSDETKSTFDHTIDLLCSKLQELDRAVANSVADLVAEIFTFIPSATINKLVDECSSFPDDDDSSSSDSVNEIVKTMENFRRDSRRLSEVALHAAQGTLSRQSSNKVKKFTRQLENLTQKVISTAQEVRNNPQDGEARARLNKLRDEWGEQFSALRSAIDNVINVEGFAAATEANIVDDMIGCREATNKRDWAKVVDFVHKIATKARRVSDVARSRSNGLTDSKQKSKVREAVKLLEIAVREMLELSKKLVKEDPVNEETLMQFIKSLEHVLNQMHSVQNVIPESIEPVPTYTSTPVQNVPTTSTPVQRATIATEAHHLTPTAAKPYYQHSSSSTDNHLLSSVAPHYFATPTNIWIKRDVGESLNETTPSSFAPTISLGPLNEPLLHNKPSKGEAGHEFQVPILYPSSLGGLSTHPSLIGTQSWQSETSVTNNTKEKGTDTTLLEVYSQQLKDVVTAATQGNPKQLKQQATALSEKSQQLVKMAETAAANAKDQEIAHILNKEAAKINYLTPRIMKKAEELLHGEEQDGGNTELELLTQQWTGHVGNLIQASHDANMPWSRSARRLVSSAKTRKGLKKEISHINTQTEKMVNVATTTIKAAAIEDAIGSTGNLELEPDHMLQDQIEQVKGHMEDIQTIAPNFISTAQKVAETGPQNQEEKLTLLSHKWATKANVLMSGIDNITIGMSGPADSLLIAANSKDSTLFEDQCSSISSIAKSMMSVSQDAIQGCTNEEQIKTVTETAKALENLSTELVACAKEIAATFETREEDHHLAIEKAEILRRDWAAKMHLLTAYIDDLTARVAGPLDRLVSVALQASRTEGMAKDHIMQQFEKKEKFINDQMEVITAKLNSVHTSYRLLQNCLRSWGFLQKVSPHAIGAAQSLSSDPGSAKLDHFSHLRRQWAAKAQCFYANLQSTNEHNDEISPVIAAFEDLLQGHTKPTARSLTKTKATNNSKDVPLQSRYYSTEDIDCPPSWPAPPIPLDEDDESLKESPSRYQQLMKTPSSPQFHTKVRPKLDITNEESVSEVSLNKSIIYAAKSLRDAANEFMEEGNPLIALTKQMSDQMMKMAQYSRARTVDEVNESIPKIIDIARDISKNAREIYHYATLISEQCTDKRTKSDLLYCAEVIPTLSTQLNILATVKESTPDMSADMYLVKNAQNLMSAVIQTIRAAEAAYVKGLKPPDNNEEDKTVKLAIQWKRNQYFHRTMETMTATIGAKGLRQLSKQRYSAIDCLLLYQKSITGESSK